MKKYNFNAGPSMLPREVIEKTAQQCLDFNGSGLSLMEISHRNCSTSQRAIQLFSLVAVPVSSSA